MLLSRLRGNVKLLYPFPQKSCVQRRNFPSAPGLWSCIWAAPPHLPAAPQLLRTGRAAKTLAAQVFTCSWGPRVGVVCKGQLVTERWGLGEEPTLLPFSFSTSQRTLTKHDKHTRDTQAVGQVLLGRTGFPGSHP